MVADVAPDFEYVPPPGVIPGVMGVYRGPEGVEAVDGGVLGRVIDDVQIETASMGGTGVALDRDLVQLWTVRDGRGVFLRVFQTKAEALEAAGLSE